MEITECSNAVVVKILKLRMNNIFVPFIFLENNSGGELQLNKSIGPNIISLKQARDNYIKFGACEKWFRHFVRKLKFKGLPGNNCLLFFIGIIKIVYPRIWNAQNVVQFMERN